MNVNKFNPNQLFDDFVCAMLGVVLGLLFFGVFVL